jgi:hypothetical protein
VTALYFSKNLKSFLPERSIAQSKDTFAKCFDFGAKSAPPLSEERYLENVRTLPNKILFFSWQCLAAKMTA